MSEHAPPPPSKTYIVRSKNGEQAICIRLVKKETPTNGTLPTWNRDGSFNHDEEAFSAATLIDANLNRQTAAAANVDESRFVQNAIEIEQEPQICVFTGDEPMKSEIIYDENEEEEVHDVSRLFDVGRMQLDGKDENYDNENSIDESNFYYGDSSSGGGEASTSLITLIPENSDPKKSPKKAATDKGKNPNYLKKRKKLLRRVVNTLWKENNDGEAYGEKDPLNWSNDEYYTPIFPSNSTVDSVESVYLHSLPAQDLHNSLFPTYYTAEQLRNFHRWPLKYLKTANKPKFQSVQSLEEHIKEVAKEREKTLEESGGGVMFFMRTVEDLSGKDGDLILCEYSEEHPPLLMQSGMATKIKNCYKKSHGQNSLLNVEPQFEYGEACFVRTSPLFCLLPPDEVMQILENGLFKAPIYLHDMPETDFLIIRDRLNNFFIRSVPNIYCVGQECPSYEVPAPNSSKASAFIRDSLLAYIYRLFWRSTETPRRLKSETLRQAFPHYAESSIRKRLKSCSVFARLGSGVDYNYWLIRNDFRLPSIEQIRQMVTPESYCAFFSMVAADQRLKDAGYGDETGVSALVVEDDEEEDSDKLPKIDDEVQCAPWNTSRAFLTAVKGKCMLDLSGVADPTGRGEGFSYVKVSVKATIANSVLLRPSYFYSGNEKYKDALWKDDAVPSSAKLKRVINGTDADLRKLSLSDARQLLRELGVKDKEIKALKRWEVIDVIRTFSTHQARAGELGLRKFARGSLRLSSNEVQDRYRQESQRIFDLQNRILSCAEYMSTDDEEDDSDAEGEETTYNQQRSTSLPKTVKPEENNQTRLNGIKTYQGERSKQAYCKKLKIFRTYRNDSGQEHTSVEIISDCQLIDAYLKIRTKDEQFIAKFAQMDKDYKMEKRREKRRLQDKLRRIKRNELKASLGMTIGRSKPTPKPPKPVKESLLKMRCSACGGNGHMKTNKHCPLYKNNSSQESSKTSSSCSTTEHESPSATSSHRRRTRISNIIVETTPSSVASIEGTKLSIKKNAIGAAFPLVMPKIELDDSDCSFDDSYLCAAREPDKKRCRVASRSFENESPDSVEYD